MIRGSQTLTSIFPPAFQADATRKGKRNIYVTERNDCMAHRFYYYYHILKKRFDVAVADMEKEFFISGSTIINCLTEGDANLKEIVALSPDKTTLRKKYPHLNWQ